MTIEVELPGGQTVEFPDGTPREVMQNAVRQYVARQAPPSPGGEPQAPDTTPPPAEPPGIGQRIGRQVGLAARYALEGPGQIAGMVGDAANALVNLPIRGVNAVAGTNIPTLGPASATIQRGIDATGLPQPETPTERIVGSMGRMMTGAGAGIGLGAALAGAAVVPAALRGLGAMLAQSPTVQGVAAAGSGLGSGVITELAPDSPMAQLAAGLAGAVIGGGGAATAQITGRTVAGIVNALRAQGVDDSVATALLRGSANPQTLAARLRGGLEEPRIPNAAPTTAVTARDPGIAMMERGLRGTPGPAGATIREGEANQNSALAQALERLGAGIPPSGTELRAPVEQGQNIARQLTGAAYRAIDPDNQAGVALNRVGRVAFDISAERYGAGSGGPPAELRRVLDDIREAGQTVDWTWLQNMRSRLGGLAGQARVQGDNNAASVYSQIRDGIDNAVAREAETGRFPPEIAERWRTATALRRQQGETFNRSPEGGDASARLLRTDQFGAPRVPDSGVADAIFASPENIRQYLTAAGNTPQVRDALQREFASRALAAARTGAVNERGDTVLSSAGFNRFIDSTEPIANELFQNRAHRESWNRLVNEFRDTAMAATMSRARGSDTSQNMTAANFMMRVANGAIDPDGPLARSMIGRGLSFVLRGNEQAAQELLARAMTDPSLALSLVERATPQTMRRITETLTTSGGLERFGTRALTATQMQALRAGQMIQENERPRVPAMQ